MSAGVTPSADSLAAQVRQGIGALASCVRSGEPMTEQMEANRSAAVAALDVLVERLAEAEEAVAAPDEWLDEEGHLRGYEQGDDPRDALDRLGFIYASLPDKDEPRKSVALECLRLADSQIERAEAAVQDNERLREQETLWDTAQAWVDEAVRQRDLAEARGTELELEVARQLTPLDIAITHIEIIRRKRDDYTADERDNIAAIVERHAREARQALFAVLGSRPHQEPPSVRHLPHACPECNGCVRTSAVCTKCGLDILAPPGPHQEPPA